MRYEGAGRITRAPCG
uniref:Uncharacterized protein n=1 Tax=Arundo donax TaxID=35708 RepID=A0A0A9HH83_ARUDO